MQLPNRLKLAPNRARATTMAPSITHRLRKLREGQRRRQNQRARNTVNPGTQPLQARRTQQRSIGASQRPPARATTTRSTHRSQGLERRQLPNQLKLAPNRAMMAAIIITLRLLTLRNHQRRRQNQAARNTANPGTQPLQARRTEQRSIRPPQRPPARAAATRNTLRSQDLQRRHPRNRLKMGPKRATRPTVVPSITLRLLALRNHQRRRQNQAARNTANPGTQPLQARRTEQRSIRPPQRPPARAAATRNTLRSQDLQRRHPRNRLKMGPKRATRPTVVPSITL